VYSDKEDATPAQVAEEAASINATHLIVAHSLSAAVVHELKVCVRVETLKRKGGRKEGGRERVRACVMFVDVKERSKEEEKGV